jgi:hypothetical protein
MKKIIITLTFAFAALAGFSQTKPKKQYQLILLVDSSQYIDLQQRIAKAYNCLDKSESPHHDVSDAMDLMKQLSEVWQKEKVEQDIVARKTKK